MDDYYIDYHLYNDDDDSGVENESMTVDATSLGRNVDMTSFEAISRALQNYVANSPSFSYGARYNASLNSPDRWASYSVEDSVVGNNDARLNRWTPPSPLELSGDTPPVNEPLRDNVNRWFSNRFHYNMPSAPLPPPLDIDDATPLNINDYDIEYRRLRQNFGTDEVTPVEVEYEWIDFSHSSYGYSSQALRQRKGSTQESNVAKRERTPDLFDALELYTKYPIKAPVHRMLTPMGVKVIDEWLRMRSMGFSYTDYNDLIGFDDVLPKHTFVYRGEEYNAGGKFVNRLDKLITAFYGRKFSSEEKTEIGNLLEHHWVGGDQYWFDIANRIDWQSGAFGEKDTKDNKGSCWWYDGGLDNPYSRVSRFSSYMQSGNALALRLWLKDGDNFHGVGRCWVLRTLDGYPILFNSYGFNSPVVWAAKLSRTLNYTTYSKVDLYVNFPSGSINGGYGVLLNHPENHCKFNYEFRLP